MSTEKRGMLRTNRLMAVPPLRAKQVSSATNGITRMRSAACRRYCSAAGIKVFRHGYVVFRVEFSAPHEHALALAEVYASPVYFLQPGVIVAFRKPEEEALHLHVLAVGEERLKPSGTEVAKSFHQDIRLMKRLALWHVGEQFEDCAFGRGHR